jgi:hypothetical protein
LWVRPWAFARKASAAAELDLSGVTIQSDTGRMFELIEQAEKAYGPPGPSAT